MIFFKKGVQFITDDDEEYISNLASQKKEETMEIYWKSVSYDEAVDIEIRKEYPQRRVEAIINNYLSEPDNEEYSKEFCDLQEYRKACKAFVKEQKQKYAT